MSEADTELNADPEIDGPASQPDDDNPEWTEAEMRSARPVLELFAEVYGQDFADALRKGPGRPQAAAPKVNQTLRLDQDVVAAYRASGRGWHARINEVLRANMPTRQD
jgi:uncharacterized protein (DUF4415 family)